MDSGCKQLFQNNHFTFSEANSYICIYILYIQPFTEELWQLDETQPEEYFQEHIREKNCTLLYLLNWMRAQFSGGSRQARALCLLLLRQALYILLAFLKCCSPSSCFADKTQEHQVTEATSTFNALRSNRRAETDI